jgi:rod shape-determining protein MreD
VDFPKHESVLKFIAYGLFLIILFILQAMVFPRLAIGGIKPLIIPIAVIGVSMFEGGARGCVFGLFAGLLCDISLDSPTIAFTLLLTAAGIIMSMLTQYVMTRGFPSFLFSSVILLMLSSFAQVCSLIVYGYAGMGQLISPILKQTLYSMAFTIPVYYTIRRLSRRSRV